jgi:hypothetical protein
MRRRALRNPLYRQPRMRLVALHGGAFDGQLSSKLDLLGDASASSTSTPRHSMVLWYRNGASQLRVTKQTLSRAQVAGLLVDLCRLRAAHWMGATSELRKCRRNWSRLKRAASQSAKDESDNHHREPLRRFSERTPGSGFRICTMVREAIAKALRANTSAAAPTTSSMMKRSRE